MDAHPWLQESAPHVAKEPDGTRNEWVALNLCWRRQVLGRSNQGWTGRRTGHTGSGKGDGWDSGVAGIAGTRGDVGQTKTWDTLRRGIGGDVDRPREVVGASGDDGAQAKTHGARGDEGASGMWARWRRGHLHPVGQHVRVRVAPNERPELHHAEEASKVCHLGLPVRGRWCVKALGGKRPASGHNAGTTLRGKQPQHRH